MTIAELIRKLQEVPDEWHVYATKSGGSIEVWDPDGVRYGFVFTDGREARMLTDRRKQAEASRHE